MWFVIGMMFSWIAGLVLAMMGNTAITVQWLVMQSVLSIAVGAVWHLIWGK